MTPNPFLKQSTPPWERDRPASAPTTSTASASVSQSAPGASGQVHLTEEDQIRLVDRARLIKAEQDKLAGEYNEIRSLLWESVGRQFVKLPGGASFRKGSTASPRRKTDLKALKERHPDVYDEVVTETPPDPNATGALYL